MKAKTQKPELLKQNDIISFYHIQLPQWLFADKRYNRLSLAAKMAYSLLLNRHQLSKLHGWINEDGEVYVIYPRNKLAEILQVGSHKVISIFKELSDIGLIWEKRRGNNKANHIFLTRVKLSEEDAAAYDNAPFMSELESDTEDDVGSAESACPSESECAECIDNTVDSIDSLDIGHAKCSAPEVRESHISACENNMSGGANNAGLDMRNSHPNYINSSQKDKSHIENSQSVHVVREEPDRRTDDEIAELDEILERCDLWTFPPATAKVFENAIERLYFSESYKIGNCVLPGRKVRSHLHELDQIKLQTAETKIARNTEKEIRNTTAYTMAVVFNSIWETESDAMNDPYLNSLRSDAPPGGGLVGGET